MSKIIILSLLILSSVLITKELNLNYKGLEDKVGWEKVGVSLPKYNVKQISQKTRENPIWVHFGIGNIFRFFIGGIADNYFRKYFKKRDYLCRNF